MLKINLRPALETTGLLFEFVIVRKYSMSLAVVKTIPIQPLACIVYLFCFFYFCLVRRRELNGAASITIAGVDVDDIFNDQEHGSTSLVWVSIINLWCPEGRNTCVSIDSHQLRFPSTPTNVLTIHMWDWVMHSQNVLIKTTRKHSGWVCVHICLKLSNGKLLSQINIF